VRSEIDSVDHDLIVFEQFLKHLDGSQPRSLSAKQDGIRIVAFHSADYTKAIKQQSHRARQLTEEVESVAVDAVHYTDTVMMQFNQFDRRLQSQLHKLVETHARLRDDLQVLENNSGVVSRWLIRRRLRRTT